MDADMNADIIRSLLFKTRERGCTIPEEQSAVAMAVRLIGKYGFDAARFAADWPPRYAFDGTPKEEPRAERPRYSAPPRQERAEPPPRREQAKPRFDDRARRSVNAKPGTIAHMANDLLQLRFHTTWVRQGLTYAEVLDAIRQKFPGCNTSIETLRWYESKLRKMGRDVPKRYKEMM